MAVISWNSAQDLPACLSSLRDVVDAGYAQVFVVDNASTDGAPDLVKEEFPWAHLIRSERNLGFGAAGNLAFRSCKSPWFAVGNADIELRPGALRTLVCTGEDSGRAGILAPGVEELSGALVASTAAFPRVRGAMLAATGLRSLHPGLRRYSDFGRQTKLGSNLVVEWALGAFLLFRNEAFASFGGFDDDQWLYGEDLEVCWRAARAGWEVLYVPSARVLHRGGASSSQVWTNSEVEVRKARAGYEWIRRRRGEWRAVLISLLRIAGAALRVIVWTVGQRAGVVDESRASESRVWLQINREAALQALSHPRARTK